MSYYIKSDQLSPRLRGIRSKIGRVRDGETSCLFLPPSPPRFVAFARNNIAYRISRRKTDQCKCSESDREIAREEKEWERGGEGGRGKKPAVARTRKKETKMRGNELTVLIRSISISKTRESSSKPFLLRVKQIYDSVDCCVEAHDVSTYTCILFYQSGKRGNNIGLHVAVR